MILNGLQGIIQKSHVFLALYHIFNRILANKKCIALQIYETFLRNLQRAANFFRF